MILFNGKNVTVLFLPCSCHVSYYGIKQPNKYTKLFKLFFNDELKKVSSNIVGSKRKFHREQDHCHAREGLQVDGNIYVISCRKIFI